ncbi:MAG: aminomethyltransferase, partial [Chloroflexi bacterium]|nr:aminomethyltransferase [Chloroflexota bacterium]
HGELAGARAARERADALRAAAAAVAPTPLSAEGSGKRFVCVCEDVTSKEIAQGVAEGFDDLETLKRYSTVTMGPCQGKMCHVASARLRSALTGQPMSVAALTTARPPFQPVTLATLAGPHLAPVRRTAMHERHAARGAKWLDMGDWKRPHTYTTVEGECRAVRERVAIIDVSTLGKLDLRGRDAGAFLDWLHPNRFSDLKHGRVRYRAMCDDSGIVIDDGTVARLGPDRFFVTTTTSSLDAVDQWLRWWLAGAGRDLTVTDVTSHFAAINLAGPRSRDVLRRLTDLDVTKEAMPYLAAVEGEVAGVPAVILRIGFVGELSYEIHVPADYGAELWDALLHAGRDLGIEPFGVEAQRVLRLEKQHLIVGQDSDALSGPLESGLAWLVKAEKPDFVGRSAIRAVAARGAELALVGFKLADRAVPDEGTGVLRDGTLVGRVTSAKWSDTLGRTVGLAIVPTALGVEGAAIDIRGRAGTQRARVTLEPFYDPGGTKLRS